MDKSRRSFVAATAAITAGAALGAGRRRAFANPLGLPLGLQLYSVREMLAKDYAGTLKQLSAIGYQEVEAAGFYGQPATEVKEAMKAAGLNCVSSHHSSDSLVRGLDETITYCQQLGVRYVICSFPGIKDPSRLKDTPNRDRREAFTMEDYRWNAENFNAWGKKVKAAGMQFGYHNHTMEFAGKDGVIPLKEMFRLTDPELVTFELDCGWVMVGGADPAAYLREYRSRISMMHVKDFKPSSKPMSVTDPPAASELGRGMADYKSIFSAIKGGGIRHAFVEQEGFDMPALDALAIDARYMGSLH